MANWLLKPVLAVLLCMWFQPSTATLTGGELLKGCREVTKFQNKESYDRGGFGSCLGDICGVRDMEYFVSSMTQSKMEYFCIPDDASGKRIVNTVIDGLEKHREVLSASAIPAVVAILSNSFPCSP